MNPSPRPTDPAGASEALAGVPPQLVARLAGRAPDAGQPSRAVLAAALLRIQTQRQNQISASVPASAARRAIAAARARGRRFSVPPWTGWAAAAGLAVIFAWEHADPLGDGTHNGSGGSTGDAAVIAGHAGKNSSSGGDSGTEAGGHGGPAMPDFSSEADGRKSRAVTTANSGKHRPQTLTAVQNMAQLRRDLARLRAANEARFQAFPGLSRTVVVEMTDPSSPRDNARQSTLRLSDRVAESIAAGVTRASESESASADAAALASGTLASTSAEPSDGSLPSPQKNPPKPSEQDLVLSGGDGSWSGDIVIEKGMPNTGLFNLPEGTQIKHLDFPVDDAASYRGLQDLGSGWFYDQFSDLLWQPTGQGHVYTGQKAPAGFDAGTFTPPPGEAVPQMTENPVVPASQPAGPGSGSGGNAPASGTSTDSPPVDGASSGATALTQVASNTPPVRGYPIFDETTGSGSIILQNLPDPASFAAHGDGLSLPQNTSVSSSTSTSGASVGSGQVYQLWVTDPASDQPISVGLIPTLDGGNGRVWFDLGSPGVAPSGYILTLEPGTGSTIPSGKVVLQGP